MDNRTQIELKNLSMSYYTFNQGINSFKDYVLKLGFVKPFARKKVLDNVNLRIEKGEVVGILGKNGTGKSSLLRVVAGIMTSYKGTLHVQGRLAPMLAIGSGIEMELTGFENIKLLNSLMGIQNSQKNIKEIIEFSELSQSDLNRHVKTYSTGMIARLSFSIAISFIPDILLIDEVLAVGDAGFQQKCLNRIEEIKKAGSTILFVSHSEADVRKICTRAICLHNGQIAIDGTTDEALKFYNQLF